MNESKQAVFLSYASEDADAAQRICDALRSAGVEVWFDKNELRGGDAWDHRIREQIHDCRLFIPVISAQSEPREEGYFRREWKLAVDRTHDMAESRTLQRLKTEPIWDPLRKEPRFQAIERALKFPE